MNNRFKALKTEDSGENRFQQKLSPGRFEKKDGGRFEKKDGGRFENSRFENSRNSRFDNKNKVEETNERGEKKWRRSGESENNRDRGRGRGRGNNFKRKKYHKDPNYDPRNDVKLKKQSGFSTFGELDITSHLLKSKSKQMKQKNMKRNEGLKELSKDNKNRIDFKKEEEITEEDRNITLAMAQQYMYYTESEEEENSDSEDQNSDN